LRQRRFAELAGEWAAQCTTIGRRVRIQLGPHVVEGLAEALNEDGALLLRTEHGHLEAILSGDVTLLKPER
jgi:BirA family biotin operon repressor/biotin-[acetyl-CoA-carboxylase] ligase